MPVRSGATCACGPHREPPPNPPHAVGRETCALSSSPTQWGIRRGWVRAAGGRLLAVGRTSGLIQVWDPRDGRLVQSLEGPARGSFPRTFLDEGRILVSDHPDGTSRFWEVATGREVFRLEGRSLRACSADGRWAASVSPRDVVLIWDVNQLLKNR